MWFKSKLWALWLLAVTVLASWGQNETPPIDFGHAALPTSKEDMWKWGIGIITPVIIWAFSKIPNIPRPLLPVLTPFVGLLLGVVLKYLASLHLNWMDMAQAGALGVFIRETVNQLVTKQLTPLEASKTAAKPVDGAIAVKDT